MSEISILIVEDDVELNNQMTELFVSKGYKVEQSFCGEDGLVKALSSQHQLILLDVMLPKRDGFSVLKMLRKSCATPVIMVTAKGAEQEKIEGFYQGADDYVSKPFNPVELMLRIEALLRRSHSVLQEQQLRELELEGLSINLLDQSVLVDDQQLDFTPIQFKLLWELVLHRGDVLSKAFLYQRVLNKNLGEHDRSIDMHLSRVRRKLNDANWQGKRIQTSHGKGYCLV